MISGLFALMFAAAADAAPSECPADEAPIACGHCAEWNQEQKPFKVFGNTYYVGTHGLSSVLIVTKSGLILLDGDLPQSARAIAAHIKALGYDVHDVRRILATHAHFDHVGGIAALQRESGANVSASALAADTLRVGIVPANDPQSNGGKAQGFPAVQHVEAVLDGESVSLGGTTVTAHYTPGHTAGGTTWTWQSCEGFRCVDVVYADSLTAVSDGPYRFGDTARSPTTADVLRHSIALVRNLSCDVLLTVHPDAGGVLDKAEANAKDPSKNAFIDRGACRALADRSEAALDQRLKDEAAGTVQ